MLTLGNVITDDNYQQSLSGKVLIDLPEYYKSTRLKE